MFLFAKCWVKELLSVSKIEFIFHILKFTYVFSEIAVLCPLFRSGTWLFPVDIVTYMFSSLFAPLLLRAGAEVSYSGLYCSTEDSAWHLSRWPADTAG